MNKDLELFQRDDLTQAIVKGLSKDKRRGSILLVNQIKLGLVKSDYLKEFKANLIKKNLKPSSVDCYVSEAKAGIREQLEKLPLTAGQRYELEKSLDKIKSRKKAPTESAVKESQYISQSELKNILKHYQTDKNIKTIYLLKLLFHTGLRISEALNIKLSDIKQSDSMVELTVIGKGNKARSIRIDKNLFESVREVYKGKTFLFESGAGKQLNRVNIYKQVHRLFSHAGYSLSPHSLRHSFATCAIESGIPINEVADYLGHSNIQTTASMYAHNVVSNDRLRGLLV